MYGLGAKPGVVVGHVAWGILRAGKKKSYAHPAIGCASCQEITQALAAASKWNKDAPLVIEISHSGAASIAGDSLPNGDDSASIAGAIAAGLHVRTLAPMYDVPVILHSSVCRKSQLRWFEGILRADREFFSRSREPLFSSHGLRLWETEGTPFDEDLVSASKSAAKRLNDMGSILEVEIDQRPKGEGSHDGSGPGKLATSEDV